MPEKIFLDLQEPKGKKKKIDHPQGAGSSRGLGEAREMERTIFTEAKKHKSEKKMVKVKGEEARLEGGGRKEEDIIWNLLSFNTGGGMSNWNRTRNTCRRVKKHSREGSIK